MIDIHAHILPGIDDGAEDTQEMLEMAKLAVESGVTAIVATPHVNFPGVYENYYDKYYIEKFQWTEKKLQEAEIPLRLYAGMEVFVTPDVPELLKQGNLLTINGGRYLLVEFAYDEEPQYVRRMLEKIAECGVCPVIAHPERYEFLQDYPHLAKEWKKQGYVIQANKGSFTGRFGKRAKALAYYLVDEQLIGVIASDCHGARQRTSYMLDAYEEIGRNYQEEYLERLFNDNPKRICMNQPIVNVGKF